MEIILTRNPKANKMHLCDYCRQKINIGAVYRSDAINNEGDFYTWKSHIACTKIANELSMFDYTEGLTGDDFQESIIEESRHEKYDIQNELPFTDRLEIILNYHNIK